MPTPPSPVQPPTPARPAIEPTSDAVLLTYTGAPVGLSAPARDLHGGDLARILYIGAVHAGSTPEPPSPQQLAALADELVASGAFTWVTNPAVAVAVTSAMPPDTTGAEATEATT